MVKVRSPKRNILREEIHFPLPTQHPEPSSLFRADGEPEEHCTQKDECTSTTEDDAEVDAKGILSKKDGIERQEDSNQNEGNNNRAKLESSFAARPLGLVFHEELPFLRRILPVRPIGFSGNEDGQFPAFTMEEIPGQSKEHSQCRPDPRYSR